MKIDKYKKDYILANIKLDNFYLLYNSKNNYGLIKNLFSYKDIKNGKTNYNEYCVLLYKELVNILFDVFYQQLFTLNRVLFDNTDININDLYHNIPKDILFVIENSNCDYKIEDIIGKYDNGDCFIDVLLYDLLNYCDNLKDLLEMFFEKDKWYKLREKYLHREEGKYNYNLYLKYCCLQK